MIFWGQGYRPEDSITFCADYKKLQGNVIENTLLRAPFFSPENKKMNQNLSINFCTLTHTDCKGYTHD